MSDEDKVTKGAVKNCLKDYTHDAFFTRIDAELEDIEDAIDQLPAVPDRRRSVKEIERAIVFLRKNRRKLEKKKDVHSGIQVMALSELIDFAQAICGKKNEFSKLFAEQKGEEDG